ncbi:MAG: RHS repeat-associated core domain-containing protein [Paludibacteraceae bacterium]|nr:RHS repeat-associated core domain-containing protein [Paludibacteraceae bacterium]
MIKVNYSMTVKLLIKYFNVRMVGFRTEWHYDNWNRLLDMTYNDGETVYYTYNVAGQLMKMAGDADYIHNIIYDIFGNRELLEYSNGATQEYSYDNMLRLSRTRLSTPAEGQIKDITYTYDAIGNIVSQNNQRNALPNGLGGVSLQTEDRYTFTGKELDAESNLYYYEARYNSSTYSQFTSPDPMSDKYPSVSPYLYCAGNPMMYVDPTGEEILNEIDINEYPENYYGAESIEDDNLTIMIVAHGDNEGITLHNSNRIISPEMLEEYLDANSDSWCKEIDRPNLIVLYCCNTGNGDNSFAEKCGKYFGAKYNIKVIAPTTQIIVNYKDCEMKGAYKNDMEFTTPKDYHSNNSSQWKMCDENGRTISGVCTGWIFKIKELKSLFHIK